MTDKRRTTLLSRIEDFSQEIVLADVGTGIGSLLDMARGLKTEETVVGEVVFNRFVDFFLTHAASVKDFDFPIFSSLFVETLKDAVGLDPSSDADEQFSAMCVRFGMFVEADDALSSAAQCQCDRPTFVASLSQHCTEAEQAALALESDIGNSDALPELRRIFHSIKGDANLCGFPHASKFAHATESLLDLLSSRVDKDDKRHFSILYAVIDHLLFCSSDSASDFGNQDLFARLESGIAVVDNEVDTVRDLVEDCAKETIKNPADDLLRGFVASIPIFDESIGLSMYREFVHEAREHLIAAEQSILALEHEPDDKELINILFRAFHTIKGAAGFMQLNDLLTFTHETETMMDLVRQGKLTIHHDISELLLHALDATKTLIDKISSMIENGGVFVGEYFDVSPILIRVRAVTLPFFRPQKNVRLGEILVGQGKVALPDVDSAVKVQQEHPEQRLGEILIEQGKVTSQQIEQALQVQQSAAPAGGFQQAAETTIKIGSDKLDAMIDMVGELVIAGTLVTENPAILSCEDQRLHKDAALLSRIIRELQNVAMSMRLVPIKPVFQKMIRVVRDITKKNGKEIEIVFNGENTEIDKNIVDMINDPIMHMVRNSCDHGVESTADRIAAGKSARGTIRLSAAHRSGAIVIEISDDGRGLNKEKIIAKALEKQLVSHIDRLTDNEIYNLIFMPGFSTAEIVTDVSGRGVGMDVVKRNIDALRGKIEIETELGKGTVFLIKLPLTLAIVDGIVLRCGGERYIVPIYAVTEFFDVESKSISTALGKGELFDVHGKMLRVIDLYEYFSGEKRAFDRKVACVVESNKGLYCLLVDELVGQQQVVLKPLSGVVSEVAGISGSAILGDGRVGLILDVNDIVEKA